MWLGRQWLDVERRIRRLGMARLVLTAVAAVVFVALVIAAVILVVRYVSGGHREPGSAEIQRGPEGVLADRYARGEIDDEEFRRRVTLLREHP